jgi:hypothetical protein
MMNADERAARRAARQERREEEDRKKDPDFVPNDLESEEEEVMFTCSHMF